MEAYLNELKNLKERNEVELWISKLSVEDATGVFYEIARSPEAFQEKILPLIAGVHLHAFIAMLAIGDKVLINFFKKYSKQELFLHKLTAATNEVQRGVESLAQASEQLLAQGLTLETATLAQFDRHCSELLHHADKLLETLQHFLEFIWVSDRPDLIERCSKVKEGLIRLKLHLKALPQKYREERAKVFHAHDQAPPIEALADIGFLYPDDIKQLASKLGWQENESEQDFLNKKLSQSKLNTVKAFKQQGIFNRTLLLQHLGVNP